MVVKFFPMDGEHFGMKVIAQCEAPAVPNVGEIVDMAGRLYVVKKRTWTVEDEMGVWALHCRIGLQRLGSENG
jgi:hypothetical protein